MIKPVAHTRWIGGRPIHVDGWLLAQGDTRERANATRVDGDTRDVSWSGLEVWRRANGGYVAFQLRMREGKPSTYVVSGDTLMQLWDNVTADFAAHFDGPVPVYWDDVLEQAIAADANLIAVM